MKTYGQRLPVIMLLTLFLAVGVSHAQSLYTWNGGGTTDNISDTGNWNGSSNANAHGIQQFAGTTRLTPFADGSGTLNTHRLYFLEGAGAFVLSGRTIGLNDHGGADPTIRNLSTNVQTIHNNIVGDNTANDDPLRVQANNGDLVLMGNITNRASPLIISGGSSTRYVALGGQVTGTPNIEIDSAQLRILEGGSINGAGGGVYIGNGSSTNTAAALLIADLDGGTEITKAINVNPGSGVAMNRAIGALNTTGINTFSGDINRSASGNRTLTLMQSGGGTVDFDGVIAGNHAVVIEGPGVVRFGGNNTYAANTEINSGELHVKEGGSISAPGQTVYVGHGLTPSVYAGLFIADADGGTVMARNISVNPGENANRTIGGLNTSGTNTFSGAIAMTATSRSSTLHAEGGGVTTFSGIISGAGSVTKTGGGQVRFEAANTYSGATTIAAGTLKLGLGASISHSTSIVIHAGATFDVSDSGGFSLQAGQTLSGSGQVQGGLIVKLDATLAPGASPGQLTFMDDVTMESGSIFEVEIAGYTPGTEYDQLLMLNSATLTIQSAALSVTLLDGFESTVLDGSVFTVVNGGNSGSFAGLGEGAVIESAGKEFRISYNDGAAITLTVVPEPTALFTLGLLVAAARIFARRR
ncbi:MAG TPA: autotransporter-associated beta strand repeat-containing protein [Kiritimatiellia bacterium]|nr:autotransporter-associated beta strand repeat-containing protein [Kiritimatiellia bacterium]